MALYRERLPLLPGAVEAVRSLAERRPLAVASSSNRPVIDLVLELAGIAEAFAATVSSEEVGRREAGAATSTSRLPAVSGSPRIAAWRSRTPPTGSERRRRPG